MRAVVAPLGFLWWPCKNLLSVLAVLSTDIHFLILLPLLGLLETPTPRPASISESVLGEDEEGHGESDPDAGAETQPAGAAASPQSGG